MVRFAASEALELDPRMDFSTLGSISKEEVQLLTDAAPATLFAASRIPGWPRVLFLRATARSLDCCVCVCGGGGA